MFGVYRLLLALMVVVGHLYQPTAMGTYAVFGFYALSGFLMTAVLHERYGYTAAGRGRYALNRALRIYPAYWLAAALSVLLIAWLGDEFVRRYHLAIFLPTTATEWAANGLLVFHPDVIPNTGPRLVPPTWRFTVELVYYALIGLGLSRTARRAAGWWAVSVAYTAYVYATNSDWGVRYYTIPAGSLPFATGACLYFLSRAAWVGAVLAWSSLLRPLPLTVAMLGNFAVAYALDDGRMGAVFGPSLPEPGAGRVAGVELRGRVPLPRAAVAARPVGRVAELPRVPAALPGRVRGRLGGARQAGAGPVRDGLLVLAVTLPSLIATAWAVAGSSDRPMNGSGLR